MYIKILVAYLIISYKKNWKQSYNSKRVDDLTIALVPIETWLEEKNDTNFEEKENDI